MRKQAAYNVVRKIDDRQPMRAKTRKDPTDRSR